MQQQEQAHLRPTPATTEDKGTITLMLGLYLIVLAFFILLNAVSEIQVEKFKQASESISSGFGFQPLATDKTDEGEEISIDQVYAALAADLRNVLEGYLPMSDYHFEVNRDQMIVRLQPKTFFPHGSWRLETSQAPFFDHMAKLIRQGRPGTELHVDVRVNAAPTEASPDKLPPLELAAMRASLFTRGLLERKVSPQWVTAGAMEAKKPEIDLYFYTVVTDENAAVQALQAEVKQAPAKQTPAEAPAKGAQP